MKRGSIEMRSTVPVAKVGHVLRGWLCFCLFGLLQTEQKNRFVSRLVISEPE